MARKRVIDPDVFHGEHFMALSVFDKLLYLGVWLHADDTGRLRASGVELKAKVLAGDPATPTEIGAALVRIASHRLIGLYQVNGTTYIAVRGFMESQPTKWVTPSKLPAPPDDLFCSTTNKTVIAGHATVSTCDAPAKHGPKRMERMDGEDVKKKAPAAPAAPEFELLPPPAELLDAVDPEGAAARAARKSSKPTPSKAPKLPADSTRFIDAFQARYLERLGKTQAMTTPQAVRKRVCDYAAAGLPADSLIALIDPYLDLAAKGEEYYRGAPVMKMLTDSTIATLRASAISVPNMPAPRSASERAAEEAADEKRRRDTAEFLALPLADRQKLLYGEAGKP